MATDMERLASFEEAYYDQYDYYNLLDYSCHAGGKGRTKREIELNTNRHCPAGHERKIAEKFHNSQMKRRRTKSSSSWFLPSMCTGNRGLFDAIYASLHLIDYFQQSAFVKVTKKTLSPTSYLHNLADPADQPSNVWLVDTCGTKCSFVGVFFFHLFCLYYTKLGLMFGEDHW